MGESLKPEIESRKIQLGEIEVEYTLAPNEQEGLVVLVNDKDDLTKVDEAVKAELLSLHWDLDPEIRKDPLLGRYEVRITESVIVDIYNYYPAITKENIEEIAESLSKFYHLLKDKSLWKVRDIVIKASDERNVKSGENYYGVEYSHQQRINLFPASFRTGKYRDCLNTTWLTGVMYHELTHLVLDHELSSLWEKNFTQLGWEDIRDFRVETPGGSIPDHFNRNYKQLVTPYSAYQIDDDRAEAVVAYITTPHVLDPVRSVIISTSLFKDLKEYPHPQIKSKEIKYNDIKDVRIYLKKKERLKVKRRVERMPRETMQPISLEKYRELKGL